MGDTYTPAMGEPVRNADATDTGASAASRQSLISTERLGAGITVADVRMPRAGFLAAAGAVLAVAALLYLDRGLSFYGDDWTFVVETIQPPRYGVWTAHNEHWVTLHRLVYSALLQTVGLRSYLPYVAVLLALHGATAVALFHLVRRRAGDLAGLGAAAVLLVFGRGADNITWAFQMEFVAPILCGLVAWLLVDEAHPGPARLLGAAALLLAGLMFSGVGLVFLIAIAVYLVLDGNRRRLTILVIPVAAYLVWFLFIGRAAAASTRSPLSLDAIEALREYVPTGLGAALAALLGISERWGPVALVVAPPLFVLRWQQTGRVSSHTLGALAGAVALFVLSGLVRDQLGAGQATSLRYLYVEATLLLLVCAEAVAGLPWRGVWRVSLVAGVTASVLLNAYHLVKFVSWRNGLASTQYTELSTLQAVRGAPDLQGDTQHDQFVLPITAAQYFTAVGRFGSPVGADDPHQLGQLPAGPVDETIRWVFGSSIKATPAQLPPGYSCLSRSSSQPLATELSPRGELLMTPTVPGKVEIFLWYRQGPPTTPTREFEASGPLLVSLPDAGPSIRWHVQVMSVGTPSQVCFADMPVPARSIR